MIYAPDRFPSPVQRAAAKVVRAILDEPSRTYSFMWRRKRVELTVCIRDPDTGQYDDRPDDLSESLIPLDDRPDEPTLFDLLRDRQ